MKKNRILLWIILLSIGITSGIALPTAVLLFAGLMPTIVSAIFDIDRQHYLTYTLALFNLCGVMPYLEELWRSRTSVETAFQLLSSPFTWLVMYGFAAVGVGLYFFVPLVVARIKKTMILSDLKQIQGLKENLVEEWGESIKPENSDQEEQEEELLT